MIKNIRPSNIQISPFVAIKDWELASLQNDDLILLEQTASDGSDIALSIDFVDYVDKLSNPVLNNNCLLALEQQSPDLLYYQEGEKIEGLFHPSESINLDGTYKRMVYSQIEKAFYNNYRDPLKIFGMENIDFPKSNTKKFLASAIRVFTLPQYVFGEKIVEGSIKFVDNSLDDTYYIEDDYNGNLMARSNLFSRQQEVRGFVNILFEGTASRICPAPLTSSPAVPLNLVATADSYDTVSLAWTDASTTEAGYYIYRFDFTGSMSGSWFLLGAAAENATSYADMTTRLTSSYTYRISAYNDFGSSSYSNTASVTTPDVAKLFTLAGDPYVLGPYDTFEGYTSGSTLLSGSMGDGWAGPWMVSGMTGPVIAAKDDFDEYTSGTPLSGSGYGVGWTGEWSVFEGI